MSSHRPPVFYLLDAPEAPFLDAGVSVAAVQRTELIAPDVTAIGGAEAVAIVRRAGSSPPSSRSRASSRRARSSSRSPQRVSGCSARGSSRYGSLRHHSTQYSSRQRTEHGWPRSSRCELAARTTPRSGFRRWRPARPIRLPVRRPSGAIASIAVRRRQFGAGLRSAARAIRWAERTNPPVLKRHTRGQAGSWPSLASSVCALSPLLSGWQWRRASALLAGVLLVALLGTRLFASGERRARSWAIPSRARTHHLRARAGG